MFLNYLLLFKYGNKVDLGIDKKRQVSRILIKGDPLISTLLESNTLIVLPLPD